MRSEAFINGWAAHRNFAEGMSVPMNPYNFETQTYSRNQWQYGYSSRKLWVEMGESVHHPDAEVENCI